ncbi:hypothetical protein V8F20_012562 [Naviculisporaceae sp. PSN 640]
MSSAQRSPARSEIVYVESSPEPEPLGTEQDQDDQADVIVVDDTIPAGGDTRGPVIVETVLFRDEPTARMAEYLARYNASGNRMWIAQTAEICAEILDGQASATPPPRVDQLSNQEVLVRRRRHVIDSIFNGTAYLSQQGAVRALRAFTQLWGPPPVPFTQWDIWRVAIQFRRCQLQDLRIPARYHRTFLLTLFENEAEGQVKISMGMPRSEVFEMLTDVWRVVREIVDNPIET